MNLMSLHDVAVQVHTKKIMSQCLKHLTALHFGLASKGAPVQHALEMRVRPRRWPHESSPAIQVFSHCAFATWALHPPGASNLAKALAKLAMSWQRFQQKTARGTNIGEKHVGCPFCLKWKGLSKIRPVCLCFMLQAEIGPIGYVWWRWRYLQYPSISQDIKCTFFGSVQNCGSGSKWLTECWEVKTCLIDPSSTKCLVPLCQYKQLKQIDCGHPLSFHIAA